MSQNWVRIAGVDTGQTASLKAGLCAKTEANHSKGGELGVRWSDPGRSSAMVKSGEQFGTGARSTPWRTTEGPPCAFSFP